MRQGLVNATLLGWIGVVVVLFRALGPRRAGLVAVFGGFLFLPAAPFSPEPHPAVPLMNTTATGLALLLGMACFGRGGRIRARLRAADLPMVAYVLAPALGFAIRGTSAFDDLGDTLFNRTMTCLVPYAFARLYLADRDGLKELALAVVVSGLLYLPIVGYESLVGPDRYLLGVIYRIPYNAGMVERLGGWRPEGFLNNGIHLASWMALSAVAACWLALARVRYPGGVPAWVPAVALLGGALLCRGMYGLLLLGVGLLVTAITLATRTRGAIVVLALLAPTYMALRVSGAWDGRALVDAAGYLGRPGTVSARIGSEDAVIHAIRSRDLTWGDGANLWASDAKLPGFWPDGKWLLQLWLGGLFGLTLHHAALHLVPIGLALSRPAGRPTRAEAGSPTWLLATLLALHMLDGMHNNADFTSTVLMAGAIVGFTGDGTLGPVTAAIKADDSWSRRLARLALVAVLVSLPELIGLLETLIGKE